MADDDKGDEALLQERARRLARPMAEARAAGEEMVGFELAGSHFCLDARLVLAIEPAEAVVPVPWAPPVFLGVMNHQGQVVPVVDLWRLLQPEAGPPGQHFFVLGRSGAEIALLANATEMVRVEQVQQQGLPEHLARQTFVRGLLAGTTVVLDGERLLEDTRLFVQEA